MTNRSSSLLPILVGLALILAALLLWWAASPDVAIHRALLLPAGSTAVCWTRRLSDAGSGAAMIPLALLAAVGLLWRGARRKALWLVLTIGSGRLVVEGVKQLVHRPRPPIADRLAEASSWSFPSSHSAGTMMSCLAFALLAGGRPPALLAALAAAGAVGWSRVALGVHWPSDVLAGWGFGLVWVGAAWRYAGLKRSG